MRAISPRGPSRLSGHARAATRERHSAASIASASVRSTLSRAKYLLLASTSVHGATAVLVRSIISQQISTAAAVTIRQRLEDLLGDAGLEAQAIADLSLDELRSVGLSRQKASYVSDLAHKVAGHHRPGG